MDKKDTKKGIMRYLILLFILGGIVCLIVGNRQNQTWMNAAALGSLIIAVGLVVVAQKKGLQRDDEKARLESTENWFTNNIFLWSTVIYSCAILMIILGIFGYNNNNNNVHWSITTLFGLGVIIATYFLSKNVKSWKK
jgi:NADH:ubiquinone oxidoreductase subunit 4 (subunit M)